VTTLHISCDRRVGGPGTPLTEQHSERHVRRTCKDAFQSRDQYYVARECRAG
jgi:hypothetical protein